MVLMCKDNPEKKQNVFDIETDLLKKYYTPQRIAFIGKHLTEREIIFMNPLGMILRGIVAKAPIFLKQNMEHYNLYKNKFNIYQSIAKFSWMPIFSWNIEKRKKQYADWTSGQYKTYAKGYDFYMDFDNSGDNTYNDFALVKQECLAVSEYLSSLEIEHSVRFSGSGLHLKAEFKDGQENPESALKFAHILKNKFMLKTPDFSIYRWQAIIKALYSIDCKTMNVCLPIPLDELEDFDKSKAHILNFINKNIGDD